MFSWEEIPLEMFLKKTDTITFLKILVLLTSQNVIWYDELLKKFWIFLYFDGGRLLYNTFQKNRTNSLPSISSLNKFISPKNENVIEGE